MYPPERHTRTNGGVLLEPFRRLLVASWGNFRASWNLAGSLEILWEPSPDILAGTWAVFGALGAL